MSKMKQLPFYTGLFYFFIRPIARIGIWVYYRKIYLAHLDRIPKNKPVILAANHPTGFMEPCVMAVFMWRPLYFLVRGDFFRKPIFNFLLRSLNMIPIFRGRDGNFRDLKSNYASFEACYQALRQNRTIMIFPEGNAKHEKRLRPIQKGVSRLAFGAFQQTEDLEDLYIVPVGVSYTYAERPRSEVMVSCAPPISVREVLAETGPHFASFDKKLRERLEADMLDNLVHVHDPADEELIENLQQINRADVPFRRIFPVLSPDNRLLLADRQVTEHIRHWSEADKASIGQQAQTLLEQLEHYGVPVHSLNAPQRPDWWMPILLAMTAIPTGLGYLFTYPATAPARRIANTKVKRTEFYSPVSLAMHLGTFLIFFLLLLFVAIFTGYWWLLPVAAGLSVLSYGALLWREGRQRWIWQRRYQQIPAEQQQELIKQWHHLKTAIRSR